MKKATGNKKGQEAYKVLTAWREENVPNFITSYEAWNLTGGLIGRQFDVSEMRLIDVAVKYTNKGGSLKDYQALKRGA